MTSARDIRVRGVVQGVGFRPFVFRLAKTNTLAGWVLNDQDGVEIHLEGAEPALDEFVEIAKSGAASGRQHHGHRHSPDASQRDSRTSRFAIARARRTRRFESRRTCRSATRASPKLFDPADRRYRYPYINCTHCGPRYSVILSLPYDRVSTTMRRWPLDAYCEKQYRDPLDRRFHAQPVACPDCGPGYRLRWTRSIFQAITASPRPPNC